MPAIPIHHRVFYLTALLLVGTIHGFSQQQKTASSALPSLIVGVNQTNLGRRSPAQQHAVIDQMKANGVVYVRFNVQEQMDASIDAIQDATQQGLHVMMVINLGNDAYFPAGTPQPSGPAGNRTRPLSLIDVSLYRKAIAQVFHQLDEKNISLLAVEVGNEFNWAPFNGDFEIHPGHPERATRDLSAMPNRTAIEQGWLHAIQLLQATRDLMNASEHNRNAFLISGGLSDVSVDWAAKTAQDMVPPAQVLQFLENHGIAKIVDGYGLHTYPDMKANPKARLATLEKLTDVCNVGPNPHPCWITEWGLPNNSHACPTDESARLPVMEEIRHDFTLLSRDGRIRGIFYFDWANANGHNHSLWRCDQLDQVGHIALAPEPVH